MGVKHRYIDRRDWKRPIERVCRGKTMPDGAYAYRTDLVRLTAPGQGFLPGVGPCKIADDGWCWLSWMRADFPWAMTAMLDENGQWVQAYFDIVSEIGCDEDGRAWFEDVWLDVVALPDGRVFLLDEDELDEAIANGEITPQDARIVRKNAQELVENLRGNTCKVFDFAKKLYESFDMP